MSDTNLVKGVCSFQDCDKPTNGRFCRKHYRLDYKANETRICSVNGCGRKFVGKGLCGVHEGRLRRYGDVNHVELDVGEGDTREQRFWSKTKRVGACLEWQGATDKDGYGVCGYRVEGRRVSRVHQMAFYITHGIVPELVRHTCDNPPCCEPDHLIDGSQIENMADKVQRDRQAKGDSVGVSKLTEVEVRQIKQLQSDGSNLRTIQRLIGRCPSAVRHVFYGATWKHI